MSAQKNALFLTLIADEAWYWDREGDHDSTAAVFARDLYHDHPQDVDGFTHREENAVYHVFKDGEYTTLPSEAPKIDFDLK